MATVSRRRKSGTADPPDVHTVLDDTEQLHAGDLMRRLSNPILTAALISAAATAAVVFVPALRFAYRGPELHIAIETAAALIGLLAAYLVYGRYRRSGQLADFVLCYSLALLACSNLFFATLPAVSSGGSEEFGTWARLCGQLLGSVLFAMAAFAPRRRLLLDRPQTIAAALSLPLLLVAVASFVAYFASRLPTGVELLPTPEASRRPRLDGNPALLAAQLAGMSLYCFAAVGFARRPERPATSC